MDSRSLRLDAMNASVTVQQYDSIGPDATKSRISHVYVEDFLRNDSNVYNHAQADGMIVKKTECSVYENPDSKVSTCTHYKIVIIIINT